MGVTMQANLRWKQVKHDMVEKARKQMERYFGASIQLGYLGVRTSVLVWLTMVRPLLEYGAEVWGDERWEEAERLQVSVGKRILRCHRHTADDAVLGELGWMPLRARRDELRLRYYMHLEAMPPTRLAKAELSQPQERDAYELRPRAPSVNYGVKDDKRSDRLWMEYTGRVVSRL